MGGGVNVAVSRPGVGCKAVASIMRVGVGTAGFTGVGLCETGPDFRVGSAGWGEDSTAG